jgi:Zn-dependent M28 family amino/carboxypeptidase
MWQGAAALYRPKTNLIAGVSDMRSLLFNAGCLALGLSSAALAQDVVIDREQALEDLRILSADDMDGRRTGTQGAHQARTYIRARMGEAGLRPSVRNYDQVFTYTPRRSDEELTGGNLVGYIEGENRDGPILVVTAHYDHIGHCGGQICNGADDNASGVSALLAIADILGNTTPEHTIVFAALDAEENGLNGARALVAELPGIRERAVLNINLDMLAINADNELPAAGAFHFPFLSAHIDAAGVVEPTNLVQGYDSPEWGPGGDWTYSSDHAAFHDAGIPWIYYGVDFHEHYHQPSDEFEVVQQDFFLSNAQTVLNAVVYFDQNLDAVADELAAHNANQPAPAALDENGRFIKPGME